MKEKELDDHGKDREISSKYGNTRVGTLRRIYGSNFALGYVDAEKLSDLLRKTPDHLSLSQLRKDYRAGTLETHINRHS